LSLVISSQGLPPLGSVASSGAAERAGGTGNLVHG